jgi:nitrate/nitrite-specific signal transduction histidine kinase
VWDFARERVSGVIQLTAANTTQIQSVMDVLKEKNAELAALNLRLKKYGENVDELTRSRERLETKARIHSELGQALLSTRRFLSEQDDAQTVPLEMWQRNIAMLRKEAVLTEDEQPLQMLSRIAAATGMTIALTGTPPEEEKLQRLFVQAAAEALTNAMSHAHAQKLYIELREAPYDYTVSFQNDGDRPKAEITEGGGLGSLRKKIESEGGTMSVVGIPEFVLTITLPKERGEHI